MVFHAWTKRELIFESVTVVVPSEPQPVSVARRSVRERTYFGMLSPDWRELCPVIGTFGIWYPYRHNIHELLVAVHLTPALQRVPRQGLEPRTYFLRDQVTPLRR